jgi:nucleotide-binding universal stress UspA family protein
MTGRIVVGVDGSEHSKAALRWAVNRAEKLGDTKVVAVLAWQMPLVGMPGAVDPDEVESRAKGYLNAIVDELAGSPPVSVARIVAHGEPAESLIETAKDADLLAVGARGRNPFWALMLGSVSQGCAAAAACPVVIVKAKT